jgi:DNA-directed RNA polymerase
MTPYERQVQIELQYSHESIIASVKSTQDALDKGRGADTPVGKQIVASAFSTAHAALVKSQADRRGNRPIYKELIARADLEIVTMAALRLLFSYCVNAKAKTLQDVFRNIGLMVETEALIATVDEVNSGYANKTLEYLDGANTHDIYHRNRTFAVAAESLHIGWLSWSAEERISVGRLVTQAMWTTGLFIWLERNPGGSYGKSIEIIQPSTELEKHLAVVVAESKSIVKYPPMVVPPIPWTSPFSGGYLTPWYQQRASMIQVRAPKKYRKDILEGLSTGKGDKVKDAMNKAQSVGYRVNKNVLSTLLAAAAVGEGIMGLARTIAPPKKEFPHPEGWDKTTATELELQEFKEWKNFMHDWHTKEVTRAGSAAGMAAKIKELKVYRNEAAIYFPTFLDSRGRMYFRSTLTPQSNDAVKACLEFAEGKPLGERGMFWLLVHIANCAGYDKHSPEIKAKWAQDNMPALLTFFEDPLLVQPPENDTAFTLYAALLNYTEAMALPDPKKYVCHLPIAMDATCSGLQHFSAMLRDEVGGHFTNLTDNGEDTKSDIYRHVGALADGMKEHITKDDVVAAHFWRDKSISRNMAKRPVMTYVYGSTIKSTMDYVALSMGEQGYESIRCSETGLILFSLNKLAVPVAKALRLAVVQTVPAAAAGMKCLQDLTKASEEPLCWVTPVGVPVCNWADATTEKVMKIRSMGRESAKFKMRMGSYDKRAAAGSIAPNFVHSLDSAHLCLVVAAGGDVGLSIVPIHDSFATHPCDVDEMHVILRREFVDMYKVDLFNSLCSSVVQMDGFNVERPKFGKLELSDVLESRYMFC